MTARGLGHQWSRKERKRLAERRSGVEIGLDNGSLQRSFVFK
ncbi:Uncharacterised protein [Vibrio cholerae]|nr:Uncharacterised protein [Vibrio cholerae]